MSSPGLRLTRQAPAAPAATVDLDAPPSDVWRDLWLNEDLRAALLDAVRAAAAGRSLTAFLDTLDEAGVDALGGGYASLVARTARGERPGFDDDREVIEQIRDRRLNARPPTWPAFDLLRETRLMGSNSPLLEGASSPAALFAMTTVTPTIAARLDLDGFRDLRADQRKGLCRLLAELARGADVRVVGRGLALHDLLRQHRTDLPASVDDSAIASLVTSRAAEQLDPDRITPAAERILDLVEAESNDTLTYAEIAERLDLAPPTVRHHVTQRLLPAGVVERVDHHGDAAVRLTFAGNAYLEEIGRQRRLESCVDGTGHSDDDTVLNNPAHVGEGGKGLVETEDLALAAHHAAAASAVSGDVTLVDHAVDRWEDGRGRRLRYDPARDELVVAVEYHRALQWWVTVAFALTEPRVLQHVLGEDRADDLLDAVGLANLRDRLQVGWLRSAEIDDGADLLDALAVGRVELADLTRKHHRDDYEDLGELESDITKLAIGLATSMIHLLWAAGADVVFATRLPEFSRNYDHRRRGALVRAVVNAISKMSTYGGHAAYRQLFEARPKKRQTALEPRVDAADPEGEVCASFVLVGDGVTALEDRLTSGLKNPDELHDDAPEFAIPATVARPTRSAYDEVADRMLASKNLRPTRDARSFLAGFAASPYAVAGAECGDRTGLSALSREHHREVRLDEVRFALATLPADRLLTDGLPTIRAMVAALLDADRPLTHGELAERAGISTRSVRRHADRLAALDLVRHTDDGWRLVLPFHTADERHADVRPWYMTPNRDRDDFEDATVAGVLWAAVEDLKPPPEEAALAGRGDVEGLRRAWPWVDGLHELLAALAVHEPERERRRTVRFGSPTGQRSLGDSLASTQTPGGASANHQTAAR